MRTLSKILFLALLLPALPLQAATPDLQAVLDAHLRADVDYWLEEPRLRDLLREANQRDTALDTAAVSALDRSWRTEMAGDGGDLTDRVASRFASNYLAEVALRMDGAYGPLLVLDNRGLVTAASELPDHADFSDDPRLLALAQKPDANWVQDRRPATGVWTGIAVPVRAANGERLGTLLFEVDVARLPAGALAGGDTRRHDDALAVDRPPVPATTVVH